MRSTDGLFLEVAREATSGQNDLVCDDRQIDAMCAELVRQPEAFGVIVTLNLYGDILSDLAAALTGGVGLAPGAELWRSAGSVRSGSWHGAASCRTTPGQPDGHDPLWRLAVASRRCGRCRRSDRGSGGLGAGVGANRAR